MLFLFLVGVEGLLRGIGWSEGIDLSKVEHDKPFWVSDPNLDAEPLPHREMDTTFSVTTDRNGLRHPIHPENKPSDTFRIMTLGCSTTFGWGVGDDESYPARLEARLRIEGYPELEVVNGGQPGYTSFQGRLLWDEVLHRYNPDVVLLGYVVQDARKVAYSDLSQAILMKNSDFLKHNLLYQWKLYLLMRSVRNQVALEAKEAGSVYRVSEFQYLENLRYLRARIEEQGGQVVHFGFPLERVGYTEQHRRILRLEAESAGIAHFDPSKEIERRTREETLYFERDRGHANAAGCDRIARLVADFLIESGLLPERGS